MFKIVYLLLIPFFLPGEMLNIEGSFGYNYHTVDQKAPLFNMGSGNHINRKAEEIITMYQHLNTLHPGCNGLKISYNLFKYIQVGTTLPVFHYMRYGRERSVNFLGEGALFTLHRLQFNHHALTLSPYLTLKLSRGQPDGGGINIQYTTLNRGFHLDTLLNIHHRGEQLTSRTGLWGGYRFAPEHLVKAGLLYRSGDLFNQNQISTDIDQYHNLYLDLLISFKVLKQTAIQLNGFYGVAQFGETREEHTPFQFGGNLAIKFTI